MVWNKNAVAYAATTMAATLMNSVFQFYYVKLFVNYYRISTYWFNTAQFIYMIWNAINDPLFGYFQDYSSLDCLKHRQLNILYGAPFFALSFLLPWFGWVDETSPPWLAGVHLLVCLSIYDCLFTFVLLAQCSLFAEISTQHHERQSMLKYSQVASIFGSSAVLVAEISSNHMDDIKGLQITCVFIAIASWMLLTYSGKNVVVSVDRHQADKAHDEGDSSWSTAFKTSFQILKNRNFLSFVIMNFLQVFHVTSCANFFSIFRELLIGVNALPSVVQSIAAGSAFILPPLTVLIIQPFIKNYGSHWLINCSFIIKIVMGIMLFLIGYEYPLVVAVFMILESTFVGATFGLFNLSVSDIIDDDQKKNNRSHPVSSMIFGLNALITKPAQSVSPMFVIYVLNQYGYQTRQKGKDNQPLKDVVFSLLVGLPIMVGCLQILCWRMFTLGIGRVEVKKEKLISL
ncbi:transmembrane protein 180-like isoform X1 [Hydractinia symbiolongicarpus]|uniref:transmembrane protein 180-like isoform X1 n=1 Tax=Hydractinia symbiolongicarpus TaxID=13093 RepID=UPI00255003CC|nr:transmembrane protein 180-like isoform X1 [Hydractinia symbiolongicarpus]